LVAISTTALVAAVPLARQPAVEGDAAMQRNVRQDGVTVVAVAVSAISPAWCPSCRHCGTSPDMSPGHSLRLCLDRLNPQQTGGQSPGQHTLNNIHGFSSPSKL
jgi:hypothetical protein